MRQEQSPSRANEVKVCPVCGHIASAKGRSFAAHNRHHAVVGAAAAHWPEEALFQPEGDKELLREWLLIRAGWVDRHTWHLPGWTHRHIDNALKLCQQAFKTFGSEARRHIEWEIDYDKSKITGIVARSTKFEKMSEEDAVRVFRAVDEKVCAVLGIETADQLLKVGSNG